MCYNLYMNNEKIIVKCITEKGAILPSYQTSGSAGADVCALLEQSICLKPGERQMIPTGLRFEIPLGFEIQMRPRSGLAAKYGISCVNSPGTIDSDYRGEIKVILINLGQEDFIINNGDRIGQVVLAPVFQAAFTIVDELSNTERGSGGFGSTGV